MLLTIIACIVGVEAQLSQNYKIPSYYGSREQDFLLRGSVYTGNLSSFYWQPAIDHVDNIYYYCDSASHVIWRIDPNLRAKHLVAGIPGQSGYRDGDVHNTLFHNPTSLIYYRQSVLARQLELSKKTIVLKDNSLRCLFANSQNYTECEDKKPTVDAGNYRIYDSIDPTLIKDIYFLEQQSQYEGQFKPPVIYVIDSGNHCIRKIDLSTSISSTVAGLCGKPGFKDGERGINRFRYPEHAGIDVLGNLFVHDQGNNYMRIISPDGYVKTLLGGACRQDPRFPSLLYQSMEIRRVKQHIAGQIMCYKSWVKTSGQPSEHLLTPSDDMNICTEHYTQCN